MNLKPSIKIYVICSVILERLKFLWSQFAGGIKVGVFINPFNQLINCSLQPVFVDLIRSPGIDSQPGTTALFIVLSRQAI
jgi:hypothetical protein